MIYYVSASAARSGNGSSEMPFCTISEAAALARPGDTVCVLPGVYREAVHPAHAGTKEQPIVYRASETGKAVITGAEPAGSWEHVRDGVWQARIDNRLFTDRNPFTTPISGDWFIAWYKAHTGDVFLNGKSMYEVTQEEEVYQPVRSDTSWDPDFSVFTWYTRQDETKDQTVLLANFQELDPNRENVEISVRKNCFFPEKEGIDYITLTGFSIRQAATQWAPPTAFQEGMVGPHWSKGWVIEDCEISESKCSGISLGKYYQPYDNNRWSVRKYKDGAQTQRDVLCMAYLEGWRKENVGSHTVRRCHIHDCGQTGIVGNLGGIFSVIEDNHIHHINNKQNLAGAEIGGIKMHAAIDVIYRRNHIHHCTRGIWLDWQAQGTRVTQNLFHDNTLPFPHLMHEGTAVAYGEDLFIEVSHGPTLVDNNVFLSIRALKLPTQGVALVHNLIAGSFTAVGRGTDNGAPHMRERSARYTPYHLPHSTDIKGFMTFLHGDMRFCNNVFVQQPHDPFLETYTEKYRDYEWDDGNLTVGTAIYDGYMTQEEWEKEFEGYCGEGGVRTDRYYMHLPVMSSGNVYLDGARAWNKETDALVIPDAKVLLSLEEKEKGIYLKTNLGDILAEHPASLITTDTLGEAFEPEQPFENPDGTPIIFDEDYFGEKRTDRLPGPFARPRELQERTLAEVL